MSRDAETKDASPAGSRKNCELPIVRARDRAADRESETGAAVVVRGGVTPIELVEDSAPLCCQDAWTTITDVEQESVACVVDADVDRAPRRCIAEHVLE